ncbi:hypothetical protein FTV88_1466 [Heliorestis convoluta]|uniref:Uncharacterized protein n=1 Tax=Heliorestis convoluta TaxID=356322 RepID=A0A5Q2N1C3_9FIRM|nr:hypothetical protein FTV88_1466 [Heliorestis convoluta]
MFFFDTIQKNSLLYENREIMYIYYFISLHKNIMRKLSEGVEKTLIILFSYKDFHDLLCTKRIL